MHGGSLLAVALASAAQAPAGQVPSADELFARLRERAQRLDGLRCTLEIERESNPLRQRLEFRSPGHLRLERLPDREPAWRRIWFSPQIAVLTPTERWTHVAWRDELVTGPPDCESLWEFRPEERPNDGWEGTARLFAALLAPDAFYKDYEIRRVFPDTLAGRPCWLVLLAGKAVAPERLWIDAERWTPLRLQVTAWTEWRRTMHHTLTVAHQREVAPGLWLPAEVWDERREYHRFVHPWPPGAPEGFERLFLTAGRLIEARLGEAPGDERFRVPADGPLLRRPAAMANAHFEWKANPPFRHKIPRALLAPADAEGEHALPRLRRFVASSPRIRAGYHELESTIYYFLKREEWAPSLRQVHEAAAAARPDDPFFQDRLLSTRFHDAPTLENAEKLAPLQGPWFTRQLLQLRLRTQVEAGDQAAARRTAQELIQHLAGLDDPEAIPFAPIFEAAEKGKWLAELRADAQRRAEGDPPSEIHLRLLIALAARQKDWPRYKALGERLDEVRRDALAFQVESAHMLGGDDRLRVLDYLPDGHFLAHAGALWSLQSQHRKEADWHRESHILTQLQDDFKARWREMTKAQLLWRHRLLGAWLENEPARAVAHLAQAVALAPEDESLKFRLVECLLRTPGTEEALRLFDRLRAAHPGRPELWLAAGRALPAKEHPERARQVIEGLSLAAPTEPSAAEAARRLCAEMGLFEEAASWAVEEALRRRPNAEVELELRTEAALSLVRAKQAEKAVEMWLSGVREALRQPMIEARRPRLIAAQVARIAAPAFLFSIEADAGWLKKQWLPALEAAAKGLGRDAPTAERAAIEFPLAAAHRALGDNARAAQHYARGLKLLPNFAEGSKWLDEIAPNYPLDDF
ncbi:MAG: tetratricopeptide repeat protein [Planctomycetes bacterium]|nr:tetratricopeptide repeat protein [Planctomycetota bacterium]